MSSPTSPANHSSALALLPGAAPTMSSREIAELLGSRHDKVKQSIERLADRGAISLPPLGEASFKDSAGKTQHTTEYRLGKRDSYVVVAQLSPEFTARLVDRWQDLEEAVASPQFAVPQTKAGALRLAADLAEQVEQQQALIAEQQPKAQFFDRFINASGLYGYEEAGTAAGCAPRKFCDWLKQEHLFYRGKKLMPRQKFVSQGLFAIKPELDGNGEAHLKGWVTAKGVEHFATNAPTSIRVTGVLL